jgi:hypothetical protein
MPAISLCAFLVARISSSSFNCKGQGIPVLSGLNREDHQERDNGRAGIDDELPGVTESEPGAADRPHNGNRQKEGGGPSREPCGRDGQATEPVGSRRRVGRGAFYGQFARIYFSSILGVGSVGGTRAPNAAAAQSIIPTMSAVAMATMMD